MIYILFYFHMVMMDFTWASSITIVQLERRLRGGNVITKDIYSYITQQRLGQGLTIFKEGKLFHQYLIVTFTRIEGLRLEKNQN